ncbi:hypothetical protein [Planobispora rosea]|uniref:hypothetical protein n=1 Tax=Planobispora rosea TaxID=35762 RepID=UPI00083B77A9|nr:hypothetical protein [Planobispora rosea]
MSTETLTVAEGARLVLIASALQEVAEELEALPYARVTGNVDVLPRIQRAAGELTEDALIALDAHREALGVRDDAVYRWTTPMPVVEVVAQLRGAAQAVTG